MEITRRWVTASLSMLPLLLRHTAIAAANPTLIPGRKASVRFPIEVLANAVFFPASVNGHAPVLFAFDTGSSNSVIASELAHELGIAGGAHFLSMGAGSGSNQASRVADLAFDLPGGIRRRVSDGAMISMEGLWPLIGKKIYGDIGFDAVSPFVVEIDYARQYMTLHDPADWQYRGNGATLPFRFYGDYDPQIEGSLSVEGQPPIPVHFTIDTGAGGTIVASPLVDKYNLLRATGKSVATQDRGVGGAEPSEVMARLPALNIGPYRIAAPLVALSRDKAGSLANENISVNLGGNILLRFTVIIDYPNKLVHLEPNGHLNDPFESDASGLVLSAEGADFRTFVIQDVLAGSPGRDSGLAPGDEIIAIDGKSPRRYALWQLEDALKKAGTSAKLTIRRGQDRFMRDIALRSLI